MKKTPERLKNELPAGERLIDDIDFSDDIFMFYGQNVKELLNKYYYQDVLIEHLKIQDLLDDEYRDNLIEWLKKAAYEERKQHKIDEKLKFFKEKKLHREYYKEMYNLRKNFKLLVALLMLRIKQSRDSVAFYILNDYIINNDYFFEYCTSILINELFELFFTDAVFFIQQTLKYESYIRYGSILEAVFRIIGSKIFNEYEFIRNDAKVKLKKGQILVHPEAFSAYSSKNIKQMLKKQPTEPVFFMPTDIDRVTPGEILYKEEFSAWEKGLVYFYELGKYWGEELISQLSPAEKAIYDQHVYPGLKIYMIRNYHVHTPDGYVVLRKEASVDAEGLAQIINDEYVCFIADSGDRIYNSSEDDIGTWIEDGWVFVHYPKLGIKGYIHSSQLEGR